MYSTVMRTCGSTGSLRAGTTHSTGQQVTAALALTALALGAVAAVAATGLTVAFVAGLVTAALVGLRGRGARQGSVRLGAAVGLRG